MTKLIVAAVLAALVGSLHAQNYPSRPIRFIVPYVAGGAGDIFARTIGQKYYEAMGQTVVVDNRPGANAIIGTDLVAKSPADGYTIVMGNSAPFVLNPSLYSKLPYDPVKDFAPITQGTYYGYVLVAQPSLPIKNLQELVAYVKTKPGLAYGSTGLGGANHLAGEFLAMMTGIKLTHVPYKGSAAALTDVLAGQLPMMFDTPITSIPQLRAGKLRAIGFSGSRRSPQMPEVPTFDELGLKGFEVSSWQGILAPAGTPKAIVDRLYREAVKALKMPDVVERLSTQGGNELIGSTPAEYSAQIKAEIVKYGRIIKDAGIRVE
ncbi:MAG: transporter substrate-binding protein [Betaproteobacteria bacterium]|nr:transporter substrate-binding protein [Betaproteobacteria bacterium]